MAGTLAQTVSQSRNGNLKIWTVNLAWTAGGSGAFTSTALSTADVMSKVGGLYLFRMKTIPGTSGAAPTDNYDITLLDSDGLDILGGAGANRSTNAIQRAVPRQDDVVELYGPVYADPAGLTLAIAGNSNASATGTVKLYFSE